jgi:hypothetical protein
MHTANIVALVIVGLIGLGIAAYFSQESIFWSELVGQYGRKTALVVVGSLIILIVMIRSCGGF